MNDSISRQAVFNTVTEYRNQLREIFGDENELIRTVDIVKHRLIALPSVQPEIIHCKDCKHYNAGFECLIEGYGIERNKNWYCADAERRNDG